LIASDLDGHARQYDQARTHPRSPGVTLARRMGTSVQMIGATYGHLARDAEDQDRGLLDAYDNTNGRGHAVGTDSSENGHSNGPENAKTL
jgi:hypothetical protein